MADLNYNLPEEIVAIMDQMLCYEMAWHDGFPLSQTLFTSLHLYSLLSPNNRPLDQVTFRTAQCKAALNGSPLVTVVLRAYCLALVKCCDLVIREIVSEHYYEEEDFITQTFTQDLLSSINTSTVISNLVEATMTLGQLEIATEYQQAIRDRLDFRQHLLTAFDHTQAGTLENKAAGWKSALDVMTSLDKSHALASPVPNAFTEKVQRYLASNTPPRPIIQVNWADTHKKMKNMCEDNIEAYRIFDVSHHFSPHGLIRFAWNYTSRRPRPSTYSRALVQGLLFKTGAVAGSIPHIDLIISDLRELVMAGDSLFDATNWEIEFPSEPGHQMARKVDEFLSKAMEEYLNIYRMILQNRCRIRRTFSQSVTILDSLQAIAEDIDADIHSITAAAPNKQVRQEPPQFYPLSAWVYFHKLRVMDWVIQLGFELDVYLKDELAAMYHLLAQTATTRSEHVKNIAMVLTARHQRLSKSGQTIPATEVMGAKVFVKILASQASATANLADGLSILFALLQTLSLIATPPRPYSSDDLRHELRLKPFLPIGTPALPTAGEIDAALAEEETTSIASLCSEAEEAFKAAKRELSVLKGVKAADGKFEGGEDGWKKEVQSLLFCTIAAGVAVAGVRDACKVARIEIVGDAYEEEKCRVLQETVEVVIPELETRYHEWWVVPKIVKKKQK